jgi:hypothetical protein
MITTHSSIPDIPPIEWEHLYDATCSLYTHPSQIAACAHLAGYSYVSPNKARILEIGSALGGNLTSIAETLPQAECIGIDPFEAQTQQAQKRAKESKIYNVRYEAIGIETAREVLEGKFDYIIAHGFCSWVSPEIREQSFSFIHDYLSPQGICYMSYNTYPRWHIHQSTRRLMQWRARFLKSGEDCVEASRNIIRSFSHFASPIGEVNARDIYAMMHTELSNKPDYYIAHEYILNHNQPFYLHEFFSMITEHNLCHITDSSFNTEWASSLLNSLMFRDLKNLSDSYLVLHQYLDFVFNRGMRRSLMVATHHMDRHKTPLSSSADHNTHSINHDVKSSHWSSHYINFTFDELATLYVSSPYAFDESQWDSNSPIACFDSYITQNKHVKLDHPILNSIMILLSAQWPHSLQISECFIQSKALFKVLYPTLNEQSFNHNTFITYLMQLSVRELVLPLRITPPAILNEVPTIDIAFKILTLISNIPLLPKLSESMNDSLPKVLFINNLYHVPVRIDYGLSQLLPYFNGAHDYKSLAKIKSSILPKDHKSLQAYLLEAYNLALLLSND